MKKKEWCTVISQEQIAEGIFSMWLQTEEIAGQAVPGQFISLYTGDKSKLLPRPISLCEIRGDQGQLRIVYRVTGEHTGTEIISKMKAGDRMEVLGPLGNGFPLDQAEGKHILLMGGGIGIPPMLETAKQLQKKARVTMIGGYRDEAFLSEDFSACCEFHAATEDGSRGTKGTVMDAIFQQNLKGDVIFACGPAPMLRAVKSYAMEQEIPCWISMEEKMACGIGACLACVCKSKEVDGHSNVQNKRVCKDGPVFPASEVEI